MKDRRRFYRAFWLFGFLLIFVPLISFGQATEERPLVYQSFAATVPQGMGVRENSMAWSMIWWNGKLYVGTSRSYGCFLRAILVTYYPWQTYPPIDEEIICTADPLDLPLGAEIWRWTPETDMWEVVYQSPMTVPIPNRVGEFTARDVGYRDMAVFVEPDGREALYVSTFTARDLIPDAPPPRLLRSIDGQTFTQVPQDSGTFLGDLQEMEGILLSGINRLTAYDGRLYAVVGGGYGHGVLLESATPWAGNDSFRVVSPAGRKVTSVETYNDQLYVAFGSNPVPGEPPFEIARTSADSALPYEYVPVVVEGGYRSPGPSTTVVSMSEFDGHLWATTNRRTETLRINPDDTWDLIVGEPRETPDGWLYPNSSLGDGFGWFFNVHVHSMAEHDGWLYMATNDQSNTVPFRTLPILDRRLNMYYGFDLYRTRDGWYVYPITFAGFSDNSFDFSGRNLVSTPHGLFLGTMNYHYGFNIWRGTSTDFWGHTLYLPLVSQGPMSTNAAVAEQNSLASSQLFTNDLLQVDGESKDGLALLAWDPIAGAMQYRILRSTFELLPVIEVDGYEFEAKLPNRFEEVALTGKTYFVDQQTSPLRQYHYYVVAENDAGQLQGASNLLRLPAYGPAITFTAVSETIESWLAPSGQSSASLESVYALLDEAKIQLATNKPEAARQILQQVQQYLEVTPPAELRPWHVSDLQIMAAKLSRRIQFVQIGLLDEVEVIE